MVLQIFSTYTQKCHPEILILVELFGVPNAHSRTPWKKDHFKGSSSSNHHFSLYNSLVFGGPVLYTLYFTCFLVLFLCHLHRLDLHSPCLSVQDRNLVLAAVQDEGIALQLRALIRRLLSAQILFAGFLVTPYMVVIKSGGIAPSKKNTLNLGSGNYSTGCPDFNFAFWFKFICSDQKTRPKDWPPKS